MSISTLFHFGWQLKEFFSYTLVFHSRGVCFCCLISLRRVDGYLPTIIIGIKLIDEIPPINLNLLIASRRGKEGMKKIVFVFI